MRSLFDKPHQKFSEKSHNSKQFQFLPNTSYASSGEVYAVSWAKPGIFLIKKTYFLIEQTHNISPTQSTISLLNTQQKQVPRINLRSLSSNSGLPPSLRRVPQQRQSRLAYPLNKLFHQPSLHSLCCTTNEVVSLQIESDEIVNFNLFFFKLFRKICQIRCSNLQIGVVKMK